MSKLALILSSAAFSLAMIATPAGAVSPDENLQKIAQAIEAGNYVSAEQQIARLSERGDVDAAVLINLGNAYAGMGRRADAELAYKAAMRADPTMELEMADGSVRSVREVASDGLRLMGVSYAQR